MLRILTFPVFRRKHLWSFFVLDGKARLPKELAASMTPGTTTAPQVDATPNTTCGTSSTQSSGAGAARSPRNREEVASALSHKQGGTWVQKFEPWLFATYLKGSEKVKQEWQELEQAPPGTWKSRFAQMGSKLMDQIPPSEAFLKNAGAHAAAIKRAKRLGTPLEEDVEEALVHMLNTNAAYHKRWLILNVMCLPLSSAMAVLPGPNVFVVWNGFRVYSHMQARKGALYLSDLIARHDAEDLVRFRPCDELSTIASEELGDDDSYCSGDCSDSEQDLPSDLDTWVQEDGPVSDMIVKRVSKMFSTPELEAHVSRLRDMGKHQKGATTHKH